MDTGVLDVAFSLGGKLFTEVGRMLVLDVFDNRVPTRSVSCCAIMKKMCLPSVIVHLISIAWSVNDIETQSHTIFFNNCISG